MSKVCRIGLDIAKNHFQAQGVDKNGKELLNNKTDAADAQAICEVVGRHATRFVHIKSTDQQCLTALHRVRERLIGNRTALVNQVRSVLHEMGIIFPQGITHFRIHIAALLGCQNEKIPIALHHLLSSLYEEFCALDIRVKTLEKELINHTKTHELCKKLLKVLGVGYLTASAIVAHVGDAKHFKNGRQFAACLGLTPREYSSGGKQRLLGISKRGNTYIRKLLIQGGTKPCALLLLMFRSL